MSDVLSAFDAADKEAGTPVAQTGSVVDAFDRANSAASQEPAPVKPSTKMERAGTGFADLFYKNAQLFSHVLPDGVAKKVDDFNKYVSGVTGLEYVPLSDVDSRVNQREQEYQQSRNAAGSTGFDWMRLAGSLANPVQYAIPGGSATTTGGRVALGALQGGLSSILSTPTTGEDAKDFWATQAKTGALGAGAGSAFTAGAEAVSPYVNKLYQYGKSKLSSILGGSASQVSDAANQLTEQAFKEKGIDASKIDPSVLGNFKAQVQDSLDHGVSPDRVTAGNLAEAASLPVPVPLLKGQASRDPMLFAREQNLRGIQGVGEPITDTLQRQNRALIDNLDAMGAKNAPNVVDAGKTIIDTFNRIDDQARQSVGAAYDAFKQSTGKSLDVPLQGVAQDYARVAHEYGMDTIPQGVRNQLNGLGLLDGKQLKVFNIDDAENLLKIINKNYDPANRKEASALDEIRKSVQSAITDGAGSSALGTEAQQLAQNARQLAAARFKMIDAVPAYKAAISGAEPDKFVKKYIWGGNESEIANLTKLIDGADPSALAAVKSSVMGDLKQSALNGQSSENGVFSQSAYNRIVRDQNNSKRLGALFTPEEMQRIKSLGNVAETAMLPPKASAVNSSNTTSAAANLVKTAAEGGLATKALSLAGKAQIPVLSPLSAGLAGKGRSMSLADLVRQSTQPLSAADVDALHLINGHAGTLGGIVSGSLQK